MKQLTTPTAGRSLNHFIRLLALACVSLSIFTLCGCELEFMENKLPPIVDDRIIGSWADAGGKVKYVFRKGIGQSYERYDPEDLRTGNHKFQTGYLAKAGETLIYEEEGPCEDAKTNQCWMFFVISLSQDTLQYGGLDIKKLIRKTLDEEYWPSKVRFTVSQSGLGTDMLMFLSGNPQEVTAFIEASSIEWADETLHRLK